MNDRDDAQALLAAVAVAHHQWLLEYGDDGAFDPASSLKGSDYNLHTLDLVAAPDVETAFQRAIELLGWEVSGSSPALSPHGGRGTEVDQPATAELAESDDV